MTKGKREQEKSYREYSKAITTPLLTVLTTLAVFFVLFVCYEMHRLKDLSPVVYLADPILAVPAAIVAFYMWRAKAKSKTDLEWEQTKQLTKLKEKYPEAFTRGTRTMDETTIEEGGNG